MFALLALFFSVLLICTGLLQLRSHLPPQKGGPVDEINGALLWCTSFMALFIATARPRLSWKLLFWLGVSAAFAALAIDEVFEFHEQTAYTLGDDDYIKIVAWACAWVGVFMIWRVARPARTVTTALLIALGFQTLWLLSDMGDGDFFTVPFIPLQTLLWIEEYLEIMASMFYLTALFVHYQDEFAITLAQPESQERTAAAAVGSPAPASAERLAA